MADFGKLGEARVEVTADTAKVKSQFGALKNTVGDYARQIGAVVAGYFALSTAFNFVKSSVKAFQEQESALRAVQVAIEQQGGSWELLRGQVESMTAAMQRKTVYADEEQERALARLITLSGDYAGSLKILPLVLDVAAASGRGLEEVGEALGKALGGNTRQIIQLLPEFRKLNEEERTGVKIIQMLTDKYGGMAEKLARTSAGEMQMAINQFGELKENIGEVAAAIAMKFIPGWNQMLTALTDWQRRTPASQKAAEEAMIAPALKATDLKNRIIEVQDVLDKMGLPMEHWSAKMKDAFISSTVELAKLKAQLGEVNKELKHPAATGAKIIPGLKYAGAIKPVSPLSPLEEASRRFQFGEDLKKMVLDMKEAAKPMEKTWEEFQVQIEQMKSTVESHLQAPFNAFFETFLDHTATISDAWRMMLKGLEAEAMRFVSSAVIKILMNLLFPGTATKLATWAASWIGAQPEAPASGGRVIASTPPNSATQLRVYIDSQQVASAVRKSQIYDYRRGAGLTLAPA